MNFALIGILVLAAILLFFMLRPTGKTSTRSAAVARKSRAERAAGSSAQADEGRYRCVSIICGPGACAEVLALGNRRFLPGQIGKLPVPGCSSPDCRCKFEHHPDRRDFEGDKRAPTALRSDLYTASGKPDRRTRKGRRKSDFN